MRDSRLQRSAASVALMVEGECSGTCTTTAPGGDDGRLRRPSSGGSMRSWRRAIHPLREAHVWRRAWGVW